LTLFKNPRWLTAAILTTDESLYFGANLTHRNEFFGTVTHMNLVTFVEHKKIRILNNSRWRPAAILKTVKLKFGMDTHIAHVNFTMRAYILRIIFYVVKLQKLQKQHWFQFLFVAKATALKQQISKSYLQILNTESSFYIHNKFLTDSMIAIFHALNLQIKLGHLMFYSCGLWLLHQEQTEASSVL